jgi:uncharacterized FAD-dependent dehydrogenase
MPRAPISLAIVVSIEHCNDLTHIAKAACKKANITYTSEVFIRIKKQSIDARSKQIVVQLALDLYLSSSDYMPQHFELNPINTLQSEPVYIIGAGPAGLFAALQCIAMGKRPVVFEQGKNVQDRRRDLVQITRHGKVNETSNYSFGEGGAGTYSDGKLYTRSTKKGSIEQVLNTFIFFGASPDIAINNHPHIGTNKLPKIISAMSDFIRSCGGEVHYNSMLTGIGTVNNAISSIKINSNINIKTKAVLLATGHSARGIYQLLHETGIAIEAKPFALGVRIEHPQQVINTMQYRSNANNASLPPAAFQLVTQVENKGVFSFCMCPGGIIAPCATGPNELVTNGWSPSKRNNKFANSGIVTEIDNDDVKEYNRFGELRMLEFQKKVEQTAYLAGGSNLYAPAQRLGDFLNNTTSQTLPECSYQPGVSATNLHDVLPAAIAKRIQKGLAYFCENKKGFYSDDAIVVGVESRTSAPVRIPRNPETLMHISTQGLYPCAEGAGYAGGIMSAAIDGINCAKQLVTNSLG